MNLDTCLQNIILPTYYILFHLSISKYSTSPVAFTRLHRIVVAMGCFAISRAIGRIILAYFFKPRTSQKTEVT
jgi:hypothetical protein